MKIGNYIPLVLLPFLITACDGPKTANEKMDAGADKVAEGVKEMAAAAGEKTDKAMGEAKVAIDELSEQSKAATANAKEKIDAAAAAAKVKIAEAAEATKVAAEEAKVAAKKAAEESAKAAEDAKAKVESNPPPR